MANLQAYFTILAGFIISLSVIFSAKTKAGYWLIKFINILLIVHIVFYCIRTLTIEVHKNILERQVLYLSYIVSYSFYAGSFIAYFAASFLIAEKQKLFADPLSKNIPAFYKVIKLSISTLFLFSSVSAIVSYDKSLTFFTASGYTPVFMVFIIIVEFTCSIGLLFTKTALCSALILMCDMVGAVYTHYHNYFSKHLPDPLGNSIPSLITQTMLITFIIITLRIRKGANGLTAT